MENALEQEKITIERDGKMIQCDILFTFDCEDTMKSYVGYTDHSVANNGRKNIYVSSYDPLNPVLRLENIEDEKELRMIHEVLQRLDQNLED